MSHVLQRVSGVVPPLVASASGLILRTADGREIIDATGGAAVACIGHGDKRVQAAVADQMAAVSYVHTSFFTVAATEALADSLVGHGPGGLTRALFLSGGSEAMEAALKIARQYFLERGQPKRTRFIARRQAYHGNTLGALASGGETARQGPFGPMLADIFTSVSPAYAYRYRQPGETEAAYVTRLADELDAEFQRLGPDTVAAFVAETVGGSTLGAVTAPAGYFRAVREVCDRYGALLILDEIFCGMGRTGAMHAWQHEGVSPDLQTIAKGLGAGYLPIAALLVHGRVDQAIADGSGVLMHGNTYSGHPVACAAALAVQRVIAADGLVANAGAMGARLLAGLHEKFDGHACVGDVRGRGLLVAIEFVADRANKTPFPRDLDVSGRIKRAALARGLATYASRGTADGHLGDHVLLAPPYIAKPAEVDRIVDILAVAVDAAMNDLPR